MRHPGAGGVRTTRPGRLADAEGLDQERGKHSDQEPCQPCRTPRVHRKSVTVIGCREICAIARNGMEVNILRRPGARQEVLSKKIRPKSTFSAEFEKRSGLDRVIPGRGRLRIDDHPMGRVAGDQTSVPVLVLWGFSSLPPRDFMRSSSLMRRSTFSSSARNRSSSGRWAGPPGW